MTKYIAISYQPGSRRHLITVHQEGLDEIIHPCFFEDLVDIVLGYCQEFNIEEVVIKGPIAITEEILKQIKATNSNIRTFGIHNNHRKEFFMN